MMLMASAGDLIIIFLGLETMSISVYVLAGLKRTDPRSNEAAIKYFLLGAFSTGFLLYGIALIYGATGTIKLEPIRAALSARHRTHQPDAAAGRRHAADRLRLQNRGGPISHVDPRCVRGRADSHHGLHGDWGKTGGLRRIHAGVLAPSAARVSADWSSVLWVVAALTMTIGNIVAVVQTNIKRMLAYSAIAHAGYLLVAMTAACRKPARR